MSTYMLRIAVIFALALILAGLLFSYKLTEIPPGINSDEASIGYNAILISKTSKDEQGRFLPLFIATFQQTDWKQPITFYSTVLVFKLFGASFFTLRLVSVIFALISLILLFVLTKEILGFKNALFGALLFITTPIIMIQSHLALENIALLPFVISWLLFLFKYEKFRTTKFLFFSAFSLGISLYSYNGMRLVLPILFLLTLIYISFLNLRDTRKTIIANSIFIAGIFPFIVTLYLSKFAYPGAIFGSARPIIPDSYQDFFLPFLSSFDLTFLYLMGDSTPYHTTGQAGMFLLATLPPFLIGCFQIFKNKRPILYLILAVFLLSPLLYSLVDSIHRASRLIMLIPPYIIITSLGLTTILYIKNNFKKIAFLALIILLLNYSEFLYDYWFNYPSRAREHFPSGAYLAFKNLAEKSKTLNLEPIIQRGVIGKEGEAARFFELVYFPLGTKKWEHEGAVPKYGVILSYSSDLHLLEKEGFERIDLEMPYYSLSFKEINH